MAASTQGNHAGGAAAAAAATPAANTTTTHRFFSISTAPAYLRLQSLYERKAVTTIWDKLTTVARQQWKWKNVPDKDAMEFRFSAPKRILQVRGPPGCGKSSATYSWVESVCRNFRLPTPAIWINCSADGINKCWTVQYDANAAGSVKTTTRPIPVDEDVGDAHTVIFDGVRKCTLERWRGLANELARQGILVVVVSSEGVFFHSGDSQDIIKLDHFVPSWVKTEYYAACQDSSFWNLTHHFFENATPIDSVERRKELVDEKYQVAGHSARFMFRQSTATVASELHQKAGSMGGIKSLEAAARSDRSVGAVNTLVARLQAEKEGPTPAQPAVLPTVGDLRAAATTMRELLVLPAESDPIRSSSFLVSALATREVMAIVPSEVGRLRSVGQALANNAITGYALELQLKKKLIEAKQPGQRLCLVGTGGPIWLNVSDVVFARNGDEVKQWLRTVRGPDIWLFVAGHQGAFDAIHIVSGTHIRFVQVTAGKEHTFKLGILDSLMTSIGLFDDVSWTHLEFMVLRPDDDDRPFRLRTTDGKLQAYKRFDGENWHRGDYRDNVQYATLDWN